MRASIIFFLSLVISGSLGAQPISSAIATATVFNEVGVNDIQLISTERISVLGNVKTLEILSFKVISNETNFSITIPTTFHFINRNGFADMTAELFATTSENKKNSQLISVTSVFKENNFLNPGNYFSSPVEITVNYN